ncbi:hypothetical protein EV363DRAFT_554564 [Boletus edulis]|nr:hypothetical protein EV363DRAFT_554564 [Boletus edulis]
MLRIIFTIHMVTVLTLCSPAETFPVDRVYITSRLLTHMSMFPFSGSANDRREGARLLLILTTAHDTLSFGDHQRPSRALIGGLVSKKA